MQIGGELPSGYLIMSEQRPSINHIAKSNGDGTGLWIDSTPSNSELLTEALSKKHEEIDKAMGENVCTEFHDDALGQTHSYDCRDVDQRNITQAIRIAEQVGHADYLAKPTGGFFQMIQHSLAQLKEVDLAMHAHISQHRSIARAKKSEAVTAHENGDIEAIKAIPVTPWQ